MKSLITLIAFIAVLNVNARSIRPFDVVLEAKLEHSMQIDENSYLAKLRIYGGNVRINQTKGNVSLNLEFAPECPADTFCPQVLRTHTIELKLEESFSDHCNVRHFVARRDLRPVDGAFEELHVADNTDNRCPTFIALPATNISYRTSVYDRINGREVKTYSSFTADPLEYLNGPIFFADEKDLKNL